MSFRTALEARPILQVDNWLSAFCNTMPFAAAVDAHKVVSASGRWRCCIAEPHLLFRRRIAPLSTLATCRRSESSLGHNSKDFNSLIDTICLGQALQELVFTLILLILLIDLIVAARRILKKMRWPVTGSLQVLLHFDILHYKPP